MKNLLLFALMVLLDTMMFGQTTGQAVHVQPDANLVVDTTHPQIDDSISAFIEPNAMTVETEKYLRDSVEWYHAYEARLAAITIYPNPTRGEIHISGLENKDNELWILQLMDCDGRLIYSTKLDPNERNIDLPEVGIGFYVIRLMDGNIAYPFRITIYN